MSPNPNNLEALIEILEKSHQPDQLNSHPWTRSLIVTQAIRDTIGLETKSPGKQLIYTIARMFGQMMPSTPPRHSKRLDTRWGEFGILAAQYFAPLIYGTPVPASLREAWGRIDQSILLFVHGKSGETLSDLEKEHYKLVGNELSIAPNSTLSDWHRKGLERLIELILRRENFLSGSLSRAAVIFKGDQPVVGPGDTNQHKPIIGRYVFPFIGLIFLGLLLFGGSKGWQIYQQAKLLRQDITALRAVISAPGTKLERIKLAGPPLSATRQDFETLKRETQPFLWMGTRLSWVPKYGGDLASVSPLVNLADALLASADISYQAVAPVLNGNTTSGLTPAAFTNGLIKAQPQFIEANHQINLAASARSHLNTQMLTPEVRDLIMNYVDQAIPIMQDGLNIAEEFPRLLGASSEGPKSYMVLVQNEDELRPTGGFITSVGTLLLENGRITSLTFVNSYDLDNWSKPYPAAPWQLQQYMESSVMVLRDTSWFTDFPTAALYAESMYSYVNSHTVDGVIAIDQQFLVEILNVVGPIKLDGVETPINSSNVIAYMRAAKVPTASDLSQSITVTKPIFINNIASALADKLFNGDIAPESLVEVLLQALNEHHLLIKMDSPSITSMLARQRWDGAVRPEPGDFLMVVDTNVGFNKTNAAVQSNLAYDVDLTNPGSPVGSLTIVHHNNSDPVICRQSHNPGLPGEEYYLITDCYFNYMRVYKGTGVKLIDAVAQFVPANWLMVKQDVPARVDILDEGIQGVQAFGTLQVVPGGESVVTSLRFALPADIIQLKAGQSVYHILIQKQPGTQKVPITIRVHLPDNVTVTATPPGAVVQKPNILYQTILETNIAFDVVFQIP